MCAPKSTSKKTKMRSGSAKGAIARMESQGKDTSQFKPTGFAKIKADIAGDLDPSKRDLGYQARLADRQKASQKALADQQARSRKRKKERRETETTPTSTTTTTTTTGTVSYTHLTLPTTPYV